jgi:hypothetical protein
MIVAPIELFSASPKSTWASPAALDAPPTAGERRTTRVLVRVVTDGNRQPGPTPLGEAVLHALGGETGAA